MQTLGEDIVLLAIRPDGRLSHWDKLRFALSGSELVRLVAARKIDLVDKRIAVVDPTAPQDPFLAAALADIRGAKRPPRATDWVAKRGQSLVDAYLAQLTAAGTIRAERRKVLGLIPTTRWYIVDAARQAAVRARLDEIAYGSGPVETAPIDTAQAALGGLVHSVQLDRVLYPGPDGRVARDRLEQAAKRAGSAEADRASTPETAMQAAAEAVIVASQAAVQASINAAVQASIQASIDAAVSASTSAAHHGGHSGGAVGGHH